MGPRRRTVRGALTTKVVEERIAGTVEALSSTSCWRGALHSPSPSQTHAQNAERHSNGPSSLVCFDDACMCRLVKLDTPVLAAPMAWVAHLRHAKPEAVALSGALPVLAGPKASETSSSRTSTRASAQHAVLLEPGARPVREEFLGGADRQGRLPGQNTHLQLRPIGAQRHQNLGDGVRMAPAPVTIRGQPGARTRPARPLVLLSRPM